MATQHAGAKQGGGERGNGARDGAKGGARDRKTDGAREGASEGASEGQRGTSAQPLVPRLLPWPPAHAWQPVCPSGAFCLSAKTAMVSACAVRA
eukprot:15438325-Alexandrium_andersonii.AAC.1